MSVAHKFTFDLDLAHKPPANKVLPQEEFDQLIAQAREEGYRQGVAAGRSAVEAQAATALANSAESLGGLVAQIMASIQSYEKQHLAQSVELAASIGRKLAAHLIARQPQAELAALITECVSSLESAPHLVIRCNPELCDAVKSIAEERMRMAGFAGRLVVMGDPEIHIGDGRIEWADGGLVRDVNAISDEINTRISAFLAASGARQGE